VEDILLYDAEWVVFHEPVSICRSLIAADELGRIYYTGRDSGPMMFRRSNMADGVPQAVRLGIPAPEAPPVVEVQEADEPGEIYSTYYLFTLVSDLGEESAPSPPSAVLDLHTGQAVQLSGLTLPNLTGRNPVTNKRIYRGNTGSSNTVEQFVAEIPANQDSYLDEVPALELGAGLATEGWLPPPEDMQGLTAVSGGALAGFSGNTLYFCEPFAPYAWPRAYRHRLEHLIAAQAATGAYLAVLTDAAVYLVPCDDVSATVPRKLEGYAPCAGPRGVVETSSGVLFPGVDGLYLVNGGSVAATNVTRGVISEEAWRAMRPETFRAWGVGEQYLCFHEDATGMRRGFVFDLAAPGTVRGLWLHATAGYLEPAGRRLHLALESGGRTSVALWEGAEVRYSAQWKSRKNVYSSPVNMAAARVDAEFPPVVSQEEFEARRAALAASFAEEIALGMLGGRVGDVMPGGGLFAGDLLDTVSGPYAEQPVLQFQYFVDGREVYSRNVTSGQPFTLPPVSGREVEVAVSGAVPVRRITLASGMAELRREG
jgi:hypothetical protein